MKERALIVVGVLGATALVIGLALGVSALLAWLAWLLWGVVAPAFGWPALTFWQVWAAKILVGLVFGGARAATREKRSS